MTKNEKEKYRKIAELGCSLCRHQQNPETPAELHLIRRAGIRSQSPFIPLGPFHHRGTSAGIHGMGRKAWEKHHNITEEILLAQTEELINGSS
jgi:hypothetical protein